MYTYKYITFCSIFCSIYATILNEYNPVHCHALACRRLTDFIQSILSLYHMPYAGGSD